MIERVNVGKTFSGRRLFLAVLDVNLRIERGEMVSIRGAVGIR